MNPPIKYPVRALRSWEGYGIEPDAEEVAEYMAKPFTRIQDADDNTVVTAHDLFEFRPGHAERIVACLNYCAGIENLEVGLVPRAEYDAKERYWIEHANKIAAERDALKAQIERERREHREETRVLEREARDAAAEARWEARQGDEYGSY